ncbi:MAG: ethanolamine utilization protein EutJ [Deltaproteobacteria bacterium]
MTTPGMMVQDILNQPDKWHFTGAKQLYAGIDLGTYKAIAIVIDETGKPRAARIHRAEVVRSGLIVDYAGAQAIVHEMMEEMRAVSPLPIEKGATSYPPKTEYANMDATRYILEAAGLEVLSVLDEPSAANRILKLQSGAIVDVGGGTTGIAVIEDNKIVFTADEATGGVHLSLVLAGNSKISETVLQRFSHLKAVCLVGGTCELEGFTEIVGNILQLDVFRPEFPQFITPLGIALSCLETN